MTRLRVIAGKLLEILGMLVVALALLAGLGILTPDGEPSMAKEMTLLGVGGLLFTLGWVLEKGRDS